MRSQLTKAHTKKNRSTAPQLDPQRTVAGRRDREGLILSTLDAQTRTESGIRPAPAKVRGRCAVRKKQALACLLLGG